MWRKLRDAYHNQRGLCAYSNLPIRIGVDAEIDHTVPKSRSLKAPQEMTIADVRWVHSKVNRMKGDLHLTEWLGLCLIVLAHFGYKVTKED